MDHARPEHQFVFISDVIQTQIEKGLEQIQTFIDKIEEATQTIQNAIDQDQKKIEGKIQSLDKVFHTIGVTIEYKQSMAKQMKGSCVLWQEQVKRLAAQKQHAQQVVEVAQQALKSQEHEQLKEATWQIEQVMIQAEQTQLEATQREEQVEWAIAEYSLGREYLVDKVKVEEATWEVMKQMYGGQVEALSPE